MKKTYFKKLLGSQEGLGVVEILIAIFIVGIAFSSLAVASTISFKLISHQKNSLQATFLCQEAIEATRSIKEEDWNILDGLSIDTDYYPEKSSSPQKWVLTLGSQSLDGFSRSLRIEDVYRDANDDITESGGTLDASTKKITATVSWTEKDKNYDIVLTNYLTDWQP